MGHKESKSWKIEIVAPLDKPQEIKAGVGAITNARVVATGAYRVEFGVDWPQGSPSFREITIAPVAGGGAISTTGLRGVPWDALLRKAAAMLLVPIRSKNSGVQWQVNKRFAEPGRLVHGSRAHRANRVSDNELRGALQIHRDAKLRGDRNPTKQVQDAFNISRQTALRWIRQAQEKGFESK